MNVDEARESLAFSEYARSRARDDLGRPWRALVLLGTISVASLALTNAAVTPVGLFWVFAGPIAAGLVALYAYRRNRTLGIDNGPLAYVAISVGLLILAYAAGKIAFAFHIGELGRAGPALVVAAGYLALAWIERSRMVGAVALALIAITVATIGLGLSALQSNALLFALYGITLVAVGLSMRVSRQGIV